MDEYVQPEYQPELQVPLNRLWFAARHDPVDDAITSAIARMREAGAWNAMTVAVRIPVVIGTVNLALRIAEDLAQDPLRRVVLSYFLETVALLAISREISGQVPLTATVIAGILQKILDILDGILGIG